MLVKVVETSVSECAVLSAHLLELHRCNLGMPCGGGSHHLLVDFVQVASHGSPDGSATDHHNGRRSFSPVLVERVLAVDEYPLPDLDVLNIA
eukprot:6491109-Amphidinium_carterae.2